MLFKKKKPTEVRLKSGGGGLGKVGLKPKGTTLKTKSSMGDDARKGLNKPGFRG